MNFKTGLWGFVIGGITGAVAALLYAPQSGEETRQILVENSEKAKQSALESIQEAQEVAMVKLNEAQLRAEKIALEARDIFDQLQDVGKKTLEREKEILEKGVEEAAEAVKN